MSSAAPSTPPSCARRGPSPTSASSSNASSAPSPRTEWVLAMDNLATHKSETAMRIITRLIGYEGDLGKEGKEGILKSVATGEKFLTNKSRRMRLGASSTSTASCSHTRLKETRRIGRHNCSCSTSLTSPCLYGSQMPGYDNG